MSKGIHLDNLKWLCPGGEFPNKEQELSWADDRTVHNSILRKVSGSDHIKLLWHEYGGPYADQWRSVFERRLVEYIQAASPATITVRCYFGGISGYGYAYRMIKAAAFLEYHAPGVPLWFELHNEPNLPEEGFGADADHYNWWADGVLDELAARGFPHGVFYAALSPQREWHAWFTQPSTQAVLTRVAGIALHGYGDIVRQIEDQADYLAVLGYGHYPLLLTEVGSTRSDRMNEFALMERLFEQYPNVLAHHVWIAEGKTGGAWDERYILTEEECRAL